MKADIPVLKSSIGYLDSIDYPAIHIVTAYEILKRCLKIKDRLDIHVLVCVFDQAIYAKAVESKWKYPNQFESLILMLGIFHKIMMYLGVTGKRYKDAGVEDVLIQSEVIAEGSVDRALAGEMYNRSNRSNKLMYEALNRLLLDKMVENIDCIEDHITTDETDKAISDYLSTDTHDSLTNLHKSDV